MSPQAKPSRDMQFYLYLLFLLLLFLTAITSTAGAPIPLISCSSFDFFAPFFSELVRLEQSLKSFLCSQVIIIGTQRWAIFSGHGVLLLPCL